MNPGEGQVMQWGGVFCLEGAWNDKKLEDRSSVLPLLELLARLDHVEFEYVHRDVGTRAELDHYLRRWIGEELPYYTLYLAFHGDASGIWLGDHEDGNASLEHLTDVLAGDLEDCVVYFGSCGVLSAKRPRLERFLERTGARAVLGYANSVDWIDSAAMDLVVLGALSQYARLDAALKYLEGAEQHASLRKSLGFRVVRR